MRSRSWVHAAAQELIGRSSGQGWSYTDDAEPAVEPTVLACLGLLATESIHALSEVRHLLSRASDWITGLQQESGAVGLCATLPAPQWPTAYFIILEENLRPGSPAQTAALHWLIADKGLSFQRIPESPVGHDTSLVGWSWVAGTHSWIEPTSMAIMALSLSGAVRSPRVEEAARLLLDRVIPGSGWNYGNSTVFGRVLDPQPEPTGRALLALASIDPRLAVESALKYLENTVDSLVTPQSLSWAVLGMAACGRRPDTADDLLEVAYESIAGSNDAARHIGSLLLASSVMSPKLFGAGK